MPRLREGKGPTIADTIVNEITAGRRFNLPTSRSLAMPVEGPRPQQIGTKEVIIDGQPYRVRVFESVTNYDGPSDAKIRMTRGLYLHSGGLAGE